MNRSPHPSPARGIGARISQAGLNWIYAIYHRFLNCVETFDISNIYALLEAIKKL